MIGLATMQTVRIRTGTSGCSYLLIAGLIPHAVDVTTHYTIQISPAYDKAKSHATFIDTFSVVRNPRDGVGNTGVYAKSAKKCPSVLNMWISTAEEHGKTYNGKQRDAHIADAALFGTVGDITYCDGQDGSDGIWRYGEKLCSC